MCVILVSIMTFVVFTAVGWKLAEQMLISKTHQLLKGYSRYLHLAVNLAASRFPKDLLF